MVLKGGGMMNLKQRKIIKETIEMLIEYDIIKPTSHRFMFFTILELMQKLNGEKL